MQVEEFHRVIVCVVWGGRRLGVWWGTEAAVCGEVVFCECVSPAQHLCCRLVRGSWEGIGRADFARAFDFLTFE